MTKILKTLVRAHNTKLRKAISEIQAMYNGVNVHLFEISRAFDDFIKNPTQINEKYHVHITNTSTSCWAGSYWYKKEWEAMKEIALN